LNSLSVLRQNKYIKAHYNDPQGIAAIQNKLLEHITSVKGRPIILLCIGTDRSTGDSLGPLTGTKIKEKGLPGLSVIGTLEHPVHAGNLATTLGEIYNNYENPYIIALDACLGRLESVGCITLAEGPLKPGTAVQKELPEVGEIHLTGIVNINGFMQYMVLQNTRLGIVWLMSETIFYIFYRTFLRAFP